MKTILYILALLLLTAMPALSVISVEPEQTMLWNDFNAISVVDSFAIGSTADGLVVLSKNQQTGLYEEKFHRFLDAEGLEHRRHDNVLAVRSVADVITFFDLSDLPSVTILGEANIGVPFEDFDWHGTDMYVCFGFDGLWRYQMTDYSLDSFSDSSMLGIHYTKVRVFDDELYALDDYNGILRYDISSTGFGEFVDYLFIPFQATHFAKAGSQFVIALTSPHILLASFDAPAPTVTDTISLLFVADRVMAADTLVSVFSNSITAMGLVSLNSHHLRFSQLSNLPHEQLNGDLFYNNTDQFVMLPTDDGGLTSYNLTKNAVDPTAKPVLARPGPITDLILENGNLYIGGEANPLDRYTWLVNAPAAYDTTFMSFTGIDALALNGDTVYAAYSSLERVLLIDTETDSLPFLGMAHPLGQPVNQLLLRPGGPDTASSFFTVGPDYAELFTVTDSIGITRQSEVSLVDMITGAAASDSLLFLSSNKTGIAIFRIYNDFDLEYRTNIGLSFAPSHMRVINDRLFAFSGSDMIVYS
ncbi:MAG: hypothetical protein V3T31_13005, partial [candidate division Zixibacteria bacterium]